MISAKFPYQKKRQQVLGLEMAYVEVGQSEVTVRGHHVPQEDSPDEIGQALATWLQNLESSSNR